MAADNKFEELLGTFSEISLPDRRVILEVAQKVPEFRDGFLRKSDYSRQMDAIKKEMAEIDARKAELAELPRLKDAVQKWDSWYSENWVPDAYGDGKGAYKRELEKDKIIEDLTSKIEAEVTFEDVNKEIGRLLGEKKLVGQDDFNKALAEKESGVREYLDKNITGLSHLVVKGPTIALKHFREFNEEIDMEGLVKYANENGIHDISKAHEAMVAPKREELKNKQWEAERVKIREEAKAEALKEVGVTSGRPPVDSSGPEMSHFQKFISRSKAEGTSDSVVPDDIPLGRGIGSYAAQVYNKRAVESGA